MPVSTIFTIGHSTRSADAFIALLKQHNIDTLVDIRTVPASRRNPQFGQDTLPGTLLAAGIVYQHESDLGGLRRAKPDSANTAWRNASFRGYADYMQTDAFTAAVDQLVTLSREHVVAIMCAEAVPWRCHRSLVGDALLVRDVTVMDIVSETSVRPHTLTAWATVNGLSVTYPGEADAG